MCSALLSFLNWCVRLQQVPSERLAAVALYIAARLAQLPLTIVDMSSAVKTSVPTFGVTRHITCLHR